MGEGAKGREAGSWVCWKTGVLCAQDADEADGPFIVETGEDFRPKRDMDVPPYRGENVAQRGIQKLWCTLDLVAFCSELSASQTDFCGMNGRNM